MPGEWNEYELSLEDTFGFQMEGGLSITPANNGQCDSGLPVALLAPGRVLKSVSAGSYAT